MSVVEESKNSSKSRKRLVRKRSIWSSLYNSPQDWFMQIEEEYEALNWDKLQKIFSIPFGISLDFLFILIKINRREDWGDDDIRLNQSYSSLELLQFTLFFICIFNTLYLFTRKKQYQIRNADEKFPPTGSHIKFVSENDDDNEVPEQKSLFSWFKSQFIMPPKKDNPNAPHIFILTTWFPPIFSLNLFCSFSPAHFGILYLMDSNNWQYIIFIIILLSAIMFYTVHSFLGLIKDKQVITEQVYNEYNIKFVNKIFIPTVDTSVEANFLDRDDYESPFLNTSSTSRRNTTVNKFSE